MHQHKYIQKTEHSLVFSSRVTSFKKPSLSPSFFWLSYIGGSRMACEYNHCANKLKLWSGDLQHQLSLESLLELQYLRTHPDLMQSGTYIFKRFQVIHMHIRAGQHHSNLLPIRQTISVFACKRTTRDAYNKADSQIHSVQCRSGDRPRYLHFCKYADVTD